MDKSTDPFPSLESRCAGGRRGGLGIIEALSEHDALVSSRLTYVCKGPIQTMQDSTAKQVH